MVLRSLNIPIHAQATYPDVVIFQHDTAPVGVPDNYRDVLRDGLGFGLRHRRSGLWQELVTSAGLPVSIKVHSVAGAFLRFTLTLNILKGLHANSRAETTELCSSNNTNWIKSPDIRRDNRNVWRAADAAIAELQTYCGTTFQHVLEHSSSGQTPNVLDRQSRTILLGVEFAYDALVAQPISFVAEIIEEIRRLGREVDRFEYHPPLRTTSRPSGLMATVKLHSGERLKVYSKTNCRVRFEIQVDSSRLRRLCPGLTRNREPLHITEETPFSLWFGTAAPNFTRIANSLIRQWRRGRAVADRTAYELISLVRGCVRDEPRARWIIDQLVTEGRASPAIGQHTLRQLRSYGVIDRGDWAVHPLSRDFIRAARLLTDAPGFFDRSVDSAAALTT